jgi:hypothetical protein
MFIVSAAVLSVLLSAAPSPAQATLFFDDFNGPTLNPDFQVSLPNTLTGATPVVYLGAPNYSFEALDGATVLRLTNTLNNRQRLGWSTTESFHVSDFRYEVRFNVLVQGPTTSIDRFIEAWLLDPSDQTRYVFAGPDGTNFGTVRRLRGVSSIDGSNQLQPFSYLDNTWYRLVVTGGIGQDIQATLFADDGTTELVGETFGFDTSAFPAGFQLGLSQSTGVPNGPYPVDVAIDWVRLTGTVVPEPSTLELAGCALTACALVAVRQRRRLAGDAQNQPRSNFSATA